MGLPRLLAGIGSPEKSLEASDDGQNFRAVAKLPDGGAPEHTVSFPAGDGEVLPRRFQADAASSVACLGRRHRSRCPWESRLAAAHRL